MTTTINASTSSGLVVTPDNSGNVLLQYNGVAAPAFAVYSVATQNGTWGTAQKITFDTEVFDTANCFTSSRFTPTVAGYYQVNGQVQVQTTSYGALALIYKNGSLYVYGNTGQSNASSYARGTVNTLVYLNGTTDYVELWGFGYGGSGAMTFGASSGADTWFNGCLLRGA